MRYKIIVDQPELEFRESRKRGHTHEIRSKGDIHVESVDSVCPKGLPNCRNCGDPAFAESCKLAGHCSDCGTKHGIAPDSVLKNNGYKLVLE